MQIDESFNIVKSSNGCRFWPGKILGEGFFIAVFKKADGGEPEKQRAIKNLTEVSKKEIEFVKQFCIVTDDLSFVNGFDGVYAVNKYLLNDMNFLNSNLRVSYFGVKAGELMRNKMIPAHALAMSHLISDSVPRILLNLDQAIKYLQKKDFNVETNTKGWQLICFENHPLGWINILPNRVNNYYPKELRILKDK